MKWINTQELVSILKRFPDEQVETSAYLGRGITSTHLWRYSAEENCFQHTISAKSNSYSVTGMFRLYGNYHWRVKPSFFLRDEREKEMAILLVEELGILGRLEDIITENELDSVRICEHCHHLMDEGWLVDDIQTFCSDKCLQSSIPNTGASECTARSLEAKRWAYWTKWEE